MDILTHLLDNDELLSFEKVLSEKIENILCPIGFNPSALIYGDYVSKLIDYLYSKGRTIIKDTLEQMDKQFFNLKGRTERYYSKGYRKREIITIFGHIVFYRHEYVDRHTNKPFIYVDEKIGLRRKDRYDPIVCALIYEMYSDINSMIKVGKLIGNLINNPFSLNNDRNMFHIPRQTIFKILHRFKSIDIPIEKAETTPSVLYIAADEKFIPSQRNDNKALMVKEALIFEGIDIHKIIDSKTGQIKYRNKLINSYRIITYQDNIYDLIQDYLDQRYDTNNIKQIYLMGDGGSWIEAGIQQLKAVDYNVSYGLDKFHFCLAVNAISKNEEEKGLLYYYSIKNLKQELKYLIEIIKTKNQERKDTIDEKGKYILNHLKAIRNMYKHIKIGCPMEQAISHDIMSQFTSVPKGYSPKWITNYLNERQHRLNKYDLRLTYLVALDNTNKDDEENIELSLKEKLNTSFFDNQIKDEYYKLNLNWLTPKMS